MATIKKSIKKTVSKKNNVNNLILKIFDINGLEKSSVELSKEIFSKTVNEKLLTQYVKIYLINQRQGTASTKTRGEVIGSTRKIYKQKGTGRARHGDIKAPIFVGGGIVGGPKPKEFNAKFNKKDRRKALLYALSLKAKSNDLIGLDESISKVEAKTKIIVNFLKKLNFTGKKLLIVLPEIKKNNLILAGRNIPRVTFINTESLNPYIILNNEKILFFVKSLKILTENLLKKP